MLPVKRIEHIAIAVDNLDTALAFWRDELGLELAQMSEVPAEKSTVAFLPVGESEIELITPTAADSGLARFLEKRGPGIHHICLAVDDLDGMLDRLKSRGIQLINATAQVGPGGKRYAFIHPKSTGGVLVELYETFMISTP